MGRARQGEMLSMQSEQLWKAPAWQGSLVGRKAAEGPCTLVSKTLRSLEQLSSGKPSQLTSSTQIRAAFLAHHPSSTQEKEEKETS